MINCHKTTQKYIAYSIYPMNRAPSLDKFLRKQLPGNNVKSWLYNKYLLFLIVGIATVHLFTLLHTAHFRCAAMFVLFGFIVSFFSKNMIVILVLALAFSGVAGMVWKHSAQEGMEDESSAKADEKMEENMEEATVDEPYAEMDNKKDKTSDVKLQTSKATLSQLKNDGKELVSLQQKILSYFKEIAPYMDKAEGLVEKMNDSATTLKSAEVQEAIKTIKEQMKR